MELVSYTYINICIPFLLLCCLPYLRFPVTHSITPSACTSIFMFIFLFISNHIPLTNILNKVGDNALPCTPLLILNHSDLPLFVFTHLVFLLYVCLITSIRSLFIFNLFKRSLVLFKVIISKAFHIR